MREPGLHQWILRVTIQRSAGRLMDCKLMPIILADTLLSLHIAKNEGVCLLPARAFRVGTWPNSIYKEYYFPGRKKNIPQNIVSTHTDDILHIENFFCNPVRAPTDAFCSAQGINHHGMVIANFGLRSNGTIAHPQGHFSTIFLFRGKKSR